MADFEPTGVDWGRVFAEALAIALDFTKRDAEDLVQEGMQLVIEGTAPFDPEGELTLAAHIVSVGLDVRKNRDRVERRRRHPRMVAKLTHWLDQEPPTPEELNDTRQRGDAAFEALLAACEGDPDVQALVLLSREDVDKPGDQAERLGWPIERVNNATKRKMRIVAAMAAAMDTKKKEEDEDP